jgi:hypothetical protein
MAYDRYDPRDTWRDERSRWSDDRNSGRPGSGDWRGERGEGYNRRGNPDDRGFFDRASDEVASWFGDDEAERRRREDRMRDQREEARGGHPSDYGRERGEDRNRNWDRDRGFGPGRQSDWNDNRGAFARGGSSADDYNRGWRRELSGGGDREQNRFRERGQGYRPFAGDYGRSDSEWDRDSYRSTSRAGTSDWSDRSRHEDPHYRAWRERHLGDLDRDYDEYRSERQSQFESDFGSWRERRQQKRGLLGQIREHMEVVGNDDEHVGTVDKIAGDRIILTKSDPESGGVHHSLSCSDIDRVEGDRVILDCSADQARGRWRDESRSRALFERDDQGEMGPRVLDRSFEGTYR